MKRLETERLILDKWTKKDARDLFAYASTPNVGPLAGWKPHETIGESKMRIKKIFIPNGIWKITLKDGMLLSDLGGAPGADHYNSDRSRDAGEGSGRDSGEESGREPGEGSGRDAGEGSGTKFKTGVAIGSIGFEPDNRRPEIKARELGYSLAEDYWGLGLMTEAGRAVIDYGFSAMDLQVISIETAPDNERSQRVIEKLGFKFEGCLRDSYLTIDDKVRDTFVYSILRSEWQASR